MTEADWLSSADPLPMINQVGATASERKLRLFLVACCRRIWHLLIYPEWREAVEAGEQFADAWISAEELSRGRELQNPLEPRWHTTVSAAVWLACAEPGRLGARCGSFTGRYSRGGTYWVMKGIDRAAQAAAEWARHQAPHVSIAEAEAAERTEQCRVLRDIFGNPFRSPILDPAWLTCNESLVLRLAQAVYDERAFDRLPILADALEEAGCTDSEILGHGRGGGEHARGCWLVDLALGKT